MKTDPDILSIIKEANEAGVIIVNISQCHRSNVKMLYETGIAY
jgi:L-asparaginase/Glu-tRNA(Gln) amidotransferase subunit D